MTPILIIFALVGLVWGTILAIRGNLLLASVGLLVATSAFGVYFFEFKFGGINLSIDRLAIVGLGVAFAVQWKLGKIELRPWMALDTVIAIFFGVLIFNTFSHDIRNLAPDQVPPVQHLINGYLIPLSVYIVARNLKYDERQVDWFLMAMTAFGVYLAVIGIMEGLGLYGFVFPRYIADPKIGLHFGRARGPMVQSVSYGVYLCGCLLTTCLLWSRASAKTKGFVFCLIPLFLAAIFFTKTRTVWAGAGVSLMAGIFLTMQGKARTVLLTGMVACGLLAVAAKSDAIMGLKREGTVEDTRRSVSMRASFTYVSWEMFLDRPILGHGFSQFRKAKLPYLADRNVDLILESIRDYDHHNTFLSVLTDLGLLGFIPFLCMYGMWLRNGWRLARSESPPWAKAVGTLGVGTVLIAFCQMVGHEITFMPFEHLLIFLVAGMNAALVYDFGLVPRSHTPAPTTSWPAQAAARG
ncbi:O-antigen ligase family protein [Bremerella sp. JC817]|uniref:O-antigen ligase family protein n=1 Tax=Bremerella sp. JC817 TaxID=3231756 RepID=UPI00345A5AE8